jgi:hypothetical protein
MDELSKRTHSNIPTKTYENLKNKYVTLKSTINSIKSSENKNKITTLTNRIETYIETIDNILKKNAIDNIIARTALPGKNPIAAPKPAVKSAQPPKGHPRNALAAILQEQANYYRMPPAKQRAYTARLKKGKLGGTRKRNYTYKKK